MVTEWLDEDLIDEDKLCHRCKDALAKHTVFFKGGFFKGYGWAWLCTDCIKREKSWWNLDVWSKLFKVKNIKNHYEIFPMFKGAKNELGRTKTSGTFS